MPTLADLDPVAQILGNVLTGEPVSHGALIMVPLLAPLVSDPGWLTLAEAGGQVQITEVSESGTVPYLTLTSTAAAAVLLLDGEELVGAKQNRILNTTVLAAAGAALTLPVSCVERGRWGYRSRGFTSSDSSLFASLRRRKTEWVSASLRSGRGHRTDQGTVWAALDAKHEEHQVESSTGAMRDFYAHFDDTLAAARQALAPLPGQVGALVYLRGRWVGLDLLAGPGLFGRAWLRLAAGYAADAIGAKPGARLTPSPRSVLRTVAGAPAEAAPAVGLGVEYRVCGERVAGAALVAEERLAHLMAFPAEA